MTNPNQQELDFLSKEVYSTKHSGVMFLEQNGIACVDVQFKDGQQYDRDFLREIEGRGWCPLIYLLISMPWYYVGQKQKVSRCVSHRWDAHISKKTAFKNSAIERGICVYLKNSAREARPLEFDSFQSAQEGLFQMFLSSVYPEMMHAHKFVEPATIAQHCRESISFMKSYHEQIRNSVHLLLNITDYRKKVGVPDNFLKMPTIDTNVLSVVVNNGSENIDKFSFQYFKEYARNTITNLRNQAFSEKTIDAAMPLLEKFLRGKKMYLPRGGAGKDANYNESVNSLLAHYMRDIGHARGYDNGKHKFYYKLRMLTTTSSTEQSENVDNSKSNKIPNAKFNADIVLKILNDNVGSYLSINEIWNKLPDLDPRKINAKSGSFGTLLQAMRKSNKLLYTKVKDSYRYASIPTNNAQLPLTMVDKFISERQMHKFNTTQNTETPVSTKTS